MDKVYADTVRLLLAAAPDVFTGDIFAMKGGTAISDCFEEEVRTQVATLAASSAQVSVALQGLLDSKRH